MDIDYLVKFFFHNLLKSEAIQEAEDDPEPDPEKDPEAWNQWFNRQETQPGSESTADPEEPRAPEDEPQDISGGDPEDIEGLGGEEPDYGDIETTPVGEGGRYGPTISDIKAFNSSYKGKKNKDGYPVRPEEVDPEEFKRGKEAGKSDALRHSAEDEKVGAGKRFRPDPEGAHHPKDSEYHQLVGTQHPDWKVGYHFGYHEGHIPQEKQKAYKTKNQIDINGTELQTLKQVHDALKDFYTKKNDPKRSPAEKKSDITELFKALEPAVDQLKVRVMHHSSEVPRLWEALSRPAAIKRGNRIIGIPLTGWQDRIVHAASSIFGHPKNPETSKGYADPNYLVNSTLEQGKLLGLRAKSKQASRVAGGKREISLSAGGDDEGKGTLGSVIKAKAENDLLRSLGVSFDEIEKDPAILAKAIKENPHAHDAEAVNALIDLVEKHPRLKSVFHKMVGTHENVNKAVLGELTPTKDPNTGEEIPGRFIHAMNTRIKYKEPKIDPATGKPKLNKAGKEELEHKYDLLKHPHSGGDEHSEVVYKEGAKGDLLHKLVLHSFFTKDANGNLVFNPDPERVSNDELVKLVPEVVKTRGAKEPAEPGTESTEKGYPKSVHNTIRATKKAFLSYLAGHPEITKNHPHIVSELLRLSAVNNERSKKRLAVIKNRAATLAGTGKPESPVAPEPAPAPAAPAPTPEAPKAPTAPQAAPAPSVKLPSLPDFVKEHSRKGVPKNELETLHTFLSTYETPHEAHEDPNHPRHKLWYRNKAALDKLMNTKKADSSETKAPAAPEVAPETPAAAAPHEQNPTSPKSHIESKTLAHRVFGSNLTDIHDFIGRIETILRKE